MTIALVTVLMVVVVKISFTLVCAMFLNEYQSIEDLTQRAIEPVSRLPAALRSHYTTRFV